MLHLDVHLGEIIAQYGRTTYAILFGIVFAETGLVLTPFLPGGWLPAWWLQAGRVLRLIWLRGCCSARQRESGFSPALACTLLRWASGHV